MNALKLGTVKTFQTQSTKPERPWVQVPSTQEKRLCPVSSEPPHPDRLVSPTALLDSEFDSKGFKENDGITTVSYKVHHPELAAILLPQIQAQVPQACRFPARASISSRRHGPGEAYGQSPPTFSRLFNNHLEMDQGLVSRP